MSDNDYEDEEAQNPLEKVGDALEVGCSISDGDQVGVIVMRHKESGEKRILLEALEIIDDADPHDMADRVHEVIAEGCSFAKVMLLPADARRLAAGLLNMADACEGVEANSNIDWDKEFNK